VTSEYEILRGDMARILYETTKDMDGIDYVFDETIVTVSEASPGQVDVTFKNRLQPTTYDLVIGADGMMSRTRRSVFGHGPKNDNYLYRLGQYSAYFTIPKTDDDTRFAQWYNASRGRLILKRPDPYGTTQIYLAVTDANLSRFDEIDAKMRTQGREEQQAWFAKEFEGAGWQSERVVRGMKESKDFYMQQIAQVKMPKWYKGHVALVGDAAYAPSPISGVVRVACYFAVHGLWVANRLQGTGSAIVGAYVLAGEVAKSPGNISAALKRYDAITRSFVDQVQKLIPGTPQIANPQTEWGVYAHVWRSGWKGCTSLWQDGLAFARV
jgi:2-polyprenyl-6-methoxyphenol hydroxylase-like FAD-dependent oxidoreductase